MKSEMFNSNARSFPPFKHFSSVSTNIKFKQKFNIEGNAGTPQDLKRKNLIIVSRGCTNKDKIAETRNVGLKEEESKTKSETETQTGLIGVNEQPALLKEVINLWLAVEVYRVKLWKDIKTAPEHYMTRLNEVLGPLSTSNDAPNEVKIPAQILLVLAKLFSSSKKIEPDDVSLDQLFGMDTAISKMRKILNRLQGSVEYTIMNVKLPSGILIHGPTRTGKSSLVHAFAREAKLPFFVVQGEEIEKNPPMIISLFSEARVSSPSIIYIQGVELITATGISQILNQMKSCKKDGAVVLVIGTADDVEKLVDGIEIGFSMLVHIGKPDMESRIKMVHSLIGDYVLFEDEDRICKYIASETSGMVWEDIEMICNECCANVIEERDTAIGICSWVTHDDVAKILEETKDDLSLLKKKDATGKEDGKVVGK